jgi:hypothetical protein
MAERRFPPPWTAEVTPNCFIVRDADGQALSYIYYESEPGRRSAAKLLSKDEARRIAALSLRANTRCLRYWAAILASPLTMRNKSISARTTPF